jgi:hypothetical protein
MKTMKKLIIALGVLVSIVSLTSCGVGAAYVFNHNQNATQVHLGSSNFNVVDKVKGSAEVSYVLIFGGMKKKSLYATAYSNMVEEANLTGSRAIVNVVTEEHIGGVPPFFFTRTITVSGHVVEFVR